MNCLVQSGDLPLRINWVYNGKSLRDYPEVSIAQIGKRSSILTIESVSYTNAGNYSCVAKNSAGRSSLTADLQINGYFFLLLRMH